MKSEEQVRIPVLGWIEYSSSIVTDQKEKSLSQMAISHKSDNPLKWSNPVSQFHGLYLTIIELQLRVYYYL